jgi:hypothetical protein
MKRVYYAIALIPDPGEWPESGPLMSESFDKSPAAEIFESGSPLRIIELDTLGEQDEIFT